MLYWNRQSDREGSFMEVYNLFYGAVYLFTGLWTGSFLNVCVWRFPRQLSPIKGRSSCPR